MNGSAGKIHLNCCERKSAQKKLQMNYVSSGREFQELKQGSRASPAITAKRRCRAGRLSNSRILRIFKKANRIFMAVRGWFPGPRSKPFQGTNWRDRLALVAKTGHSRGKKRLVTITALESKANDACVLPEFEGNPEDARGDTT